ncbi:MAG: DNA recombination protein RmuC [Paludibacteraceae bacterium]|nr:DNA recombination protein RmuC [Paludibacteraceae bacterium]
MEITLILLAFIAVLGGAVVVIWMMRKNFQQTLENQQKANAQALQVQHELFEKSLAEMKASVNATTEKMLSSTKNDFNEASSKKIDEILSPFKDRLKEMKESLDGSKTSQVEMKVAMEQQIKHLLEQTQLTAQSADELARALTHDSKYQGNWGERECQELLEHQGLRRGVEYDTQVDIKYTDEMGHERRFQPDFVLHLDQKRDVIIDSKVSLTAFKDYCNAEDEGARQLALKRHVESMETHIKELSDKDYASYLKTGQTMNFVIMFVPITGALWTALREKPDMWRHAMDKHVYIADEQTLFAALSIIKMTWTKVAQLQHQEQLYALADEMIKRVGMFYDHFKGVGKAIKNLENEYADASGKLEDKGTSIIVTANQMVKLGAKISDKYAIPEMLDVDEISDE